MKKYFWCVPRANKILAGFKKLWNSWICDSMLLFSQNWAFLVFRNAGNAGKTGSILKINFHMFRVILMRTQTRFWWGFDSVNLPANWRFWLVFVQNFVKTGLLGNLHLQNLFKTSLGWSDTGLRKTEKFIFPFLWLSY